MNSQKEFKEDLLSQYITPERIEKAPKDFTSEVMTRIRSDTRPLIVADRLWKKNLVPVISATLTVVLIASAFLIPASKADSLDNPVLSFMKNLKFSLPEIKMSSIFSHTLPSVTLYVFIGIMILTLFDRALYGIFHREK